MSFFIMSDRKDHFEDRVTVQVTTTRAGAADVLDTLETFAKTSSNTEGTWVTVAPVELPEIMQTNNVDTSNPSEDSWS